jgi:hypothetical protein
MIKNRIIMLSVTLICLLALFSGGILVWMKRGIPFVSQREQWTIGIYRGKTPFSFDSPLNRLNPVLKAEHVTDVSARFVADPFLIKEGKTWYLFFEVYNNETQHGDLAVATSNNSWIWHYKQIVLDEPFHLSYPYVVKWEDDYYLIPESFETNSIRLYKADNFPTKWSFVTTLVEGKDFVDNSIAYFNNKWWMFASTTSNDTLYLYFADDLSSPWIEHPSSPIVEGNKHIARPSGRVLEYEGSLYRYTMDVNPSFGTHQILAFEITDITPTSYSEKLVKEDPVLMATGSGWNGQAMHQIDPVHLGPDSWIAAVDGFGKYPIFGWGY